MNFGPGTSNQHRHSILRRDPELRPAITNSTRTRTLVNVTLRPNRILTDAITVTRPVFVQKKSIRTARNTSVLPYERKNKENENKLACPICFTGLLPVCTSKPTVSKCCGYVFCGQCILKCQENFKKCPMCNQRLEPNSVFALRFHNT